LKPKEKYHTNLIDGSGINKTSSSSHNYNCKLQGVTFSRSRLRNKEMDWQTSSEEVDQTLNSLMETDGEKQVKLQQIVILIVS